MAGRARATSPLPSLACLLSLSHRGYISSAYAEIQNLKAERRKRCQKKGWKGQEGAKRVRARFRHFTIVPPWGIKVIKRLDNVGLPQDIPRVIDFPLSRR